LLLIDAASVASIARMSADCDEAHQLAEVASKSFSFAGLRAYICWEREQISKFLHRHYSAKHAGDG